MSIEFKRLAEIDKCKIIELMNNHLVRRYMPLLKNEFNESVCNKFVNSKELLWLKYGYGPWAFTHDDKFIGWGGLQPEHGDVDLALVLHPKYWGKGKIIYKRILNYAFNDMKFKSITILLPKTRTQIKGVFYLGFVKESEILINDISFVKFRLNNLIEI